MIDEYKLNLELGRRLREVLMANGWTGKDLITHEPDVILHTTHPKIAPVHIEIIISKQTIMMKHSVMVKTSVDLAKPGHEEWLVEKLSKALKPFSW